MDTFNTMKGKMTNNQKTVAWVLGTLIVIIAVFLTTWHFRQTTPVITSFDECINAGYPVLQSYPEQCQTPDGKTFINTSGNSQNAIGHIKGTVTLRPICQPGTTPCALPTDAYTTRMIALYDIDGTTEKSRTTIDANGTYTLNVAAGNYLIAIIDADGGQSNKKSVLVTANGTSTIDFAIDVPLFAKG